MSRIDDAIEQLYSDPGLREDLTDAEADALFAWAESEIRRLDGLHDDEEAFAAAVEALLASTEDLNILVGRRTSADAQAQAARLDRLTADAADAGLVPDRDALEHAIVSSGLSAQSAEADDGQAANLALIAALTTTLSGSERALVGTIPAPTDAAAQAAIPVDTAADAQAAVPAAPVDAAAGVDTDAAAASRPHAHHPRANAAPDGLAGLRAGGPQQHTAAEQAAPEQAAPDAFTLLGHAIGGLFSSPEAHPSHPTPTPSENAADDDADPAR
jgi:hypothetical protein